MSAADLITCGRLDVADAYRRLAALIARLRADLQEKQARPLAAARRGTARGRQQAGAL